MDTTTTPADARTAGAYGVEVLGDLYAVDADWPNAASPVRQWGLDSWTPTAYQSADFCHRASRALRWILIEAAQDSGDEDEAAGAWADAQLSFAGWLDAMEPE